MGFFGTFWNWLNQQLATYVGTNTARLADTLEPALVTLTTVYVMAWGYLQLSGQIQEPVMAGFKRIAIIVMVLGGGLHLWLYNTVIVDTFYAAPARLAAAVVGGSDPVSAVDTIWERGGAVAGHLWDKSSGWGSELECAIAAAALWALLGLLCVYVMFLIALADVALAVLLALGPLFIGLALFGATRRLFMAWLGQLTTYALVTVLTIMVAALLLQIMESFATQTLALGALVTTVDALDLMLMAALVFLLLRQVMPIAAALGGGVALQSSGVIGRGIERGLAVGGRVRESAWDVAKAVAGRINPGKPATKPRPAPSAGDSGGHASAGGGIHGEVFGGESI